MKRMLTIMRKELIHIVRDPKTLMLVIVMPAVVDLSKSEASQGFIDRYWISGFFEITAYAESEKEILELIDSGIVKTGVLIPEGFGREIDTGGSSPVQFYIDGSNPTVAQAAQLAAETIGQVASQEIFIENLSKRIGGVDFKLPIDARIRFLYNPNMKRMDFWIPGLVAIILQIQSLLLTAFAIVREREQGTLEQLLCRSCAGQCCANGWRWYVLVWRSGCRQHSAPLRTELDIPFRLSGVGCAHLKYLDQPNAGDVHSLLYYDPSVYSVWLDGTSR